MEAKLELEISAFQQLQKEYTKAVESRTTLESQMSENEAVLKEFQFTTTGQIYKLIGPVLVNQEREEAVGNVKKRIEYIKGEITRLETRIKELEGKQEAKKMEVVKLQQFLQQQSAAAEAGGVSAATQSGAIKV